MKELDQTEEIMKRTADQNLALFEMWAENERKLAYMKSYVIMALATTAVILVIGILAFCTNSFAEEISDEVAVVCVMGEASNQGEIGMYAVASALFNRGTTKGVYGCKAKHVYKEPKWVWDMAKKAVAKARVKRLHNGDHWENVNAFGKPYWVDSMTMVYEYKDHKFYK